jgi:hypothetical protein
MNDDYFMEKKEEKHSSFTYSYIDKFGWWKWRSLQNRAALLSAKIPLLDRDSPTELRLFSHDIA